MFNLTCSLSECATELSYYDHQRSEPQSTNAIYSYIIVGGGTAGAVLANRLSSNSQNQVLLLEAGPRANWAVSIPLLSNIRVYDPKFGFQLKTVPQQNLHNRRVDTFSGKILGGTSSVNASVFTKSCHEELRSWVSDYGCGESWSPEAMEKYLDRPFQQGQPPSNHNRGPLQSRGLPCHVQSFSDRFLKALHRAGSLNVENPHSSQSDQGQGPIGIGSFKPRFTVTQNGTKSHAGNAFLPDKILRERSNLRVVTNCRVDRLHLERSEEGKSVAKGVYIKDSKGSTFFARSSKDIILSAGAFHTPPILLRSGIGPPSDLSTLSIPLQLDSPKVGKGLADHIGVILHFLCPYDSSTLKIQDGLFSTLSQGIKNALDYFLRGKGLFISAGFVEVISYLQSSQIEIIEDSDKEKKEIKLKLMNPYTTLPDIEVIFSTHWMEFECRRFKGLDSHKTYEGKGQDKKGVFGVFIILSGPTKTDSSHVKLNSIDAFDDPSIDPKFFQNPEDLERLLKAVKLILFMIQRMNLEGWEVEPADIPGFDWKKGEYHFEGMEGLKKRGNFYDFDQISDDVYKSYIRQKASAIYHPSSSCQMGPHPEDPVNPETFDLRGVENLKVCDTSIFPHVPSTHPQSLVYAAAEKLAELILEEGEECKR